jgi:GT2 family glycosyltransferase
VSTISWFIIIPVFNPPASLLDNLSKLEAASPGAVARVLLVNDGSNNDIPRQAKLRFPDLTCIEGDGSLWWCGAMKVGMTHALEKGASVIVWLNHDCVPDANTLERLVEVAAKEGNGAVSAWCRSADAPEFPVNPGFRKLREIPLKELRSSKLVVVDGVNGNCVAINATAIRTTGLPNSKKHPHYGDGPYTYRLHKAGFCNMVLTSASALLEREYDRCVSVKWRCAFWKKPLSTKLRYFYLSRKSQYHWSIKYHDAVAFRGYPTAPFAYLASMFRVFREIVSGHRLGLNTAREPRLEALCREYEGRFPREGMVQSLIRLENNEY